MTVAKPLYNEQGRQYAKLFVPSGAEKELFKNMNNLQTELERTKHLNDLLERKLKKLN